MNKVAYAFLALVLAYMAMQAARYVYDSAEEENKKLALERALLRKQCEELQHRLKLAERRIVAQEQFFHRVAAGHFNYIPAIAACMNVMRGYATLASVNYSDSLLMLTPKQIDSALAKDPRTKAAYQWNQR